LPVDAATLVSRLADFGATALSLGVRLAVALLLFAAVTAGLRLLGNRGVISRSLAGLVKWLAAIALLLGVQGTLSPERLRQLDVPITLALLASAWMACRHGVEFCYDKFFLGQGKGQPSGHILKDLIKFCILAMLVATGLKALLDIQLGSLLTSSAILTAVIGLSMQDTIGSLVSGLLLQIEKPFREGDWIKVGETEGQVKEVTWRYTKVLTLDANAVLLPNNAVAKERLLNYNRPGRDIRRVVYVPAPADAPPVKVKSAILTAMARADGVARQPAPAVRLAAIHQDHLVYAAAYSVTRLDAALATADAVLSAVWYQFLEREIAIPLPGQQVFPGRCDQDAPDPQELATLAAVDLLADMSAADVAMLTRASVIRRYAAGQTIISMGDPGTTMSIVLSGQVAVLANGQELAKLGPGKIFGEMALLTGAPRQADIRALAPTRCLEVDREGFRMALARHPDIVDQVRRICEARSAPTKTDADQGASPEDNTLFSLFKKLFL